MIPPFLKPLDGYPGAFIERLDALGPQARVLWAPDQRRTIMISDCNLTSKQLRQLADMMDATP